MLFGGLRLEEAAKLAPMDIKTVDGVVVLDINRRVGRLKTKNADRLVPVHSAILPHYDTIGRMYRAGFRYNF